MHVRRLVAITLSVFVAVILAGPLPAGATAAAPVHRPDGAISGPFPYPAPAYDDPAGHTCSFAFHAEFPINQVVSYNYTNSAGRVVATYYTGALYVKLTRTDTGKSVTANLSGDGVQVYATDGSSILYGVGPFSSSQHPGDSPPSEYAVLDGFSALKIGADGHKTILYSSHVENLCLKLL